MLHGSPNSVKNAPGIRIHPDTDANDNKKKKLKSEISKCEFREIYKFVKLQVLRAPRAQQIARFQKGVHFIKFSALHNFLKKSMNKTA